MYHLNVEIIKLNNIKCVLSISAGNLLTFFFAVCNNLPLRVISRVGKWPEIMVVCCLRGQTHQTCSYFNIAWLLTLRILPFWSDCQTQSQMDLMLNSQTFSPICYWKIPWVWDICLEMSCNSKILFGFLVGKLCEVEHITFEVITMDCRWHEWKTTILHVAKQWVYWSAKTEMADLTH